MLPAFVLNIEMNPIVGIKIEKQTDLHLNFFNPTSYLFGFKMTNFPKIKESEVYFIPIEAVMCKLSPNECVLVKDKSEVEDLIEVFGKKLIDIEFSSFATVNEKLGVFFPSMACFLSAVFSLVETLEVMNIFFIVCVCVNFYLSVG
jgi:hypothetical protein